MKRIPVTGATGNIGNEVIRSLINLNTEDHIIPGVRNIASAKQLFPDLTNLEYREFDLEKQGTLTTALENIERISEDLPEIHSAREVSPEYDDLKTDTSFLSAPAPLKKSVDFGKALDADKELFAEEMFLKEPDDRYRLQWSLILKII